MCLSVRSCVNKRTREGRTVAKKQSGEGDREEKVIAVTEGSRVFLMFQCDASGQVMFSQTSTVLL